MIKHPLLKPAAFAIYSISFFAGVSFAFVIPNFAVLLKEGLHARPFLVGLFFILMPGASIIYAQLIGLWSDKGWNRKHILFIGMIAGALACWIFAWSKNYVVVLIAGSSLLSLSYASTAQIFALGREYADEHFDKKYNSLFNSVIRAGVAVAWTAGPPLGFYLQKSLGFSKQYLVNGFVYLSVALLSILFLPAVSKQIRKASVDVPALKPVLWSQRNTTLFLGIVAFSLLYATNQSYLISLPLFLTEKFAIESYKAGWLFGTAAFLEIPVMLLAGWLGARMLLLPLIRIGGIAAVLLFIGVVAATAYWQLFPLQVFNALFVGFVAALGVTWFQDLLPGNAGSASALYINCNSIGWVMGGLIVSVFAELGSYKTVFIANTGFAILAVGILFLIRPSSEAKETAQAISKN